MPVLALDATDQVSLKIIQSGEQGDGAMADIIVRLGAYMPDPQRYSWLNALKGLNLAFFIATEHQCLIRRIQIQLNDVPEFLFEVWTKRQSGLQAQTETARIPPRASRFVGVKTTRNKKGSRDKISQPLELYGRDGVIRTLDP